MWPFQAPPWLDGQQGLAAPMPPLLPGPFGAMPFNPAALPNADLAAQACHQASGVLRHKRGQPPLFATL
eukprot:g22487.t1